MIDDLQMVTTDQLLRSISTGHLVTITGISFGSLLNGSADRCQTIGLLTLDYHCPSSWECRNERIGNASWLTGREGLSVVCLSIPELVNFLLRFGELVPNYGFAPHDLISGLIISIPTPDTGSDGIVYSMMLSSGESTNIVCSLTALGLKALLLFLMTCLNSSRKPEDLASKLTYEDSLTTTLSSGTITRISPMQSQVYHGSQIYRLLKKLSSQT